MTKFHRTSSHVRATLSGLVVAVVVTAATAMASTASASEPVIATAPFAPSARPSVGLTVGFGVRSDLVRNTGLDPFSTADSVPQSALSLSYGFGPRDRMGMALGVEWNHGESTASARGAEATLTIDRLSLGFEGRLSLSHRLVAFGRLAPGLLRGHASVVDPSSAPAAYGGSSSPALQQTSWVAAGDVSAGLACRVAEVRGLSGPVFGIWLTAEGGYGYAASHDLVLTSRVETEPGRVDEPLHLGRLAFGGAFVRARIALSF